MVLKFETCNQMLINVQLTVRPLSVLTCGSYSRSLTQLMNLYHGLSDKITVYHQPFHVVPILLSKIKRVLLASLEPSSKKEGENGACRDLMRWQYVRITRNSRLACACHDYSIIHIL